MVKTEADYGDNNVNAGPLKELKEICIDRFSGNDLLATTFFLTHAHCDHMLGLETQNFMERLMEPGVKLYCHAQTPKFIKYFDRYLGGEEGVEKLISCGKLIGLDINSPYEIMVPAKSPAKNYRVTVTALSAGHCPGSIMFLFETSSKRILHTGDCRLTVKDLERMKYLHTNQGRPKTIHNLYIDTTFACDTAPVFPDRNECVQKDIIPLIKKWTDKGKNNRVNILFASVFGHEYVILEIYKQLGYKVHVDDKRYKIYSQLPPLSCAVTQDKDTPLHLACKGRGCMDGKAYISLRLTSRWFDDKTEKHVSIKKSKNNKIGKTVKVCYSMHSSLNEIAEMIDYLSPSVVSPIVLPLGHINLDVVRKSLETTCNHKFEFDAYQLKSKELDNQENEISGEEKQDKDTSRSINHVNPLKRPIENKVTNTSSDVDDDDDDMPPALKIFLS